jgi:type 1 glutamine amidotransferase
MLGRIDERGGRIEDMTGRIDAYLVCGGKYHDFDFVRLELLKLLAEDEHIRTKVGQDFRDIDAITSSAFMVTYTCDVRPSPEETEALRRWVEDGGRWFALHATNSFFDPPAELGKGPFETPNTNPAFFEILGSQFLSHPPLGSYPVTVSPGAEHDPLVADIEPFDAGATEELYLCRYDAEVIPLLETHWTGTTQGFATTDWPNDDPRLVMYRRPLGQGEVLYFTLGHSRSHWDMIDPPFHGARWPTIDRGSWELSEHYELLRRGIAWAAAPARVTAQEATG